MNLYLLFFTLVITASFVYGSSIAAECNILNGFSGLTVSDDCCSQNSIKCNDEGYVTEM